jgi:hypothetical protein
MTTQAALSRLSLNQRTTASWSLPEAIKGCVDAGLGGIGFGANSSPRWGSRKPVGW